jgi:hypothetical protein
MMATYDVWLNGVFLTFMPILILLMFRGSKLGEQTCLGRCYRAEAYLRPVQNAVLLLLGASALTRLSVHFGWLPAAVTAPIINGYGLALLVVSICLLTLWVRAAKKVRRLSQTGT